MFVASSEERRTFDPDRGIELIPGGGGSDMSRRFTLRGANFEFPFTARQTTEPTDEGGADSPAAANRTLVWEIASHGVPTSKGVPIGITKDEIDRIIAEALLAFKFAHGLPHQARVKVRFL